MYREVTMIEVREVLRLRGEGLPKKRIAAQLGLDPKTVRRYLTAATTAGVRATATIRAGAESRSRYIVCPNLPHKRRTHDQLKPSRQSRLRLATFQVAPKYARTWTRTSQPEKKP